MPRGHPGIPRATSRNISKADLLRQLQEVDASEERRGRVLRLETAFRGKIDAHLDALPNVGESFAKFNTSPYVLLMHARKSRYSKISEIESDILPAKLFSSMETSAGRMVEEVVLPEYGWVCVESEMHSSNSSLDGKQVQSDVLRLATLKSGPRCLNDEMSENFADAILGNYASWARDEERTSIDFTYGVLYGTPRQSNKKDWHILRNIREKIEAPDELTVSPDRQWTCQFRGAGVTADATIRIGLDWWDHLGGELCFVEVFSALIRACIEVGTADESTCQYMIGDLGRIVSATGVDHDYNVEILQISQLPWLFLMANHFCDQLVD